MANEHKLVLATGNPGKKREIEHLLHALNLKITFLPDHGDLPEVEEDQPTLEGNAEKKARVIYEHLHLPSLADDTGLEVDALGGEPGVYSARYAGEACDPIANKARLLKELGTTSNRRARFRTVLAYAIDGKMHRFEGICEGRITIEERGAGGFGYDAIFLPDGSEHTFAEMSIEEKNKISHRGRALRKFAAFISSELSNA